jgi:hypothetical protein
MLRSQIEIEWKYGIVGMLINLWCCMLGIENLEKNCHHYEIFVKWCKCGSPMIMVVYIWMLYGKNECHWWKWYYVGCYWVIQCQQIGMILVSIKVFKECYFNSLVKS